jgi:hypothetical protein
MPHPLVAATVVAATVVCVVAAGIYVHQQWDEHRHRFKYMAMCVSEKLQSQSDKKKEEEEEELDEWNRALVERMERMNDLLMEKQYTQPGRHRLSSISSLSTASSTSTPSSISEQDHVSLSEQLASPNLHDYRVASIDHDVIPFMPVESKSTTSDDTTRINDSEEVQSKSEQASSSSPVNDDISDVSVANVSCTSSVSDTQVNSPQLIVTEAEITSPLDETAWLVTDDVRSISSEQSSAWSEVDSNV